MISRLKRKIQDECQNLQIRLAKRRMIISDPPDQTDFSDTEADADPNTDEYPDIEECPEEWIEDLCGPTQMPEITIDDLPDEVLLKIFGYVNIWHHNRIRCTSTRMRDVNDHFIMHEFNKALSRAMQLDPSSPDRAVLTGIQEATNVYVRSGYGSTFSGCLLPMLRSAYKEPFCPQPHQMMRFLCHFYDTVDERIGDSCTQESRLLYNLTLLNSFKKFENSTIVSTETMPLHWRANIEVKGPWLGMLWTAKLTGRSRVRPVKRNNLLVILAEMLLAEQTGNSFKRVWECMNEIYVYGNDLSNGRRTPRTVFTFTVHGSQRICALFQSYLETKPGEFEWPEKWPKDEFTVNLDINCKEAMKWGCSKSQHMEFGPFAAPIEDDDCAEGCDLPASCSSSDTLLDINE